MSTIIHIINKDKLKWFCCVLALVVLYYGLMLLALIIKFQALPNYFNTYDWYESVKVIIDSTPSWKDTLLIIKDEWWLEVGFMNYDFGIGISEWSLFVAPAKMFSVFIFSSVLITYIFVLQATNAYCKPITNHSSKVASGLAGFFFAMTSITMSWVVCCSTPTWVVGLAIMGLGVSTSLWLEPLGPWLNLVSFVLMIVALILVTDKRVYGNVITNNITD